MSIRTRISNLSTEVATQVATQLLYTRYQQIQNNASPLGKVVSTDGVNLTVQMPDGTTQKIIAAGNRNLGQGSVGIVAGGVLL